MATEYMEIKVISVNAVLRKKTLSFHIFWAGPQIQTLCS